MPVSPLPTEDILAMLAAAPLRLTAASAGLQSEQARTEPAPGEWSVNAVLAHLRGCADVWGGRIRTILAQNHPTIRAMNPRTWVDRSNYLDLDFHESLQAFLTQRAELLDVLSKLTPQEWERGATVTGAGKPLEHTVWFYAQWLARHERTHLHQIERAVKVFR